MIRGDRFRWEEGSSNAKMIGIGMGVAFVLWFLYMGMRLIDGFMR